MIVKQKDIKKHKRESEDLYLVWEYYHKLQLTKNSKIKCACKFCNRVYMCHMKRLLNHLIICKKCPEHIKTYMRTIEKKVIEKKEDEVKSKNNQNEEEVEEYSAIDDFPIRKKSKNTRCFVYGCNRTRAEFAFFHTPKEPREREIWNSIITHPFQQRDLKATDFICERHFAPSDVIRYLKVNDVRIPNKNPVLRRGCLPIKFFDDYVLKSYNRHITKLITKSGIAKKRKRKDGKVEDDQGLQKLNEESLTDLEVIEELAVNPEYEIVFENEKSEREIERTNEIPDIQNEEIVVKSESTDDIAIDDTLDIELPNVNVEYNIDTLIKPEICDMDYTDIKEEISYDSDSSEDEDIESNFFERIYETRSFPGLNDYWAISPCKNYVKPILQNLVSDNKSVVFTQMKVRNGIPMVDQQIILTADLKLEYFVGYNKIKLIDLPNEVSRTTELAATINQYSFDSCEGGPSIIIFESRSTIYYKDYSSPTWRHIQCNFLSTSGLVSMYCKYVKKYFQQKLKRYAA